MGRREELHELTAAFERQVHEEHPNPQRVDCPGPAALAKLASEPGPLGTAPILDHVRQCAACLDELRDLRFRSRPSHQSG